MDIWIENRKSNMTRMVLCLMTFNVLYILKRTTLIRYYDTARNRHRVSILWKRTNCWFPLGRLPEQDWSGWGVPSPIYEALLRLGKSIWYKSTTIQSQPYLDCVIFIVYRNYPVVIYFFYIHTYLYINMYLITRVWVLCLHSTG